MMNCSQVRIGRPTFKTTTSSEIQMKAMTRPAG